MARPGLRQATRPPSRSRQPSTRTPFDLLPGRPWTRVRSTRSTPPPQERAPRRGEGGAGRESPSPTRRPKMCCSKVGDLRETSPKISIYDQIFDEYQEYLDFGRRGEAQPVVGRDREGIQKKVRWHHDQSQWFLSTGFLLYPQKPTVPSSSKKPHTAVASSSITIVTLVVSRSRRGSELRGSPPRS